MNALISGNAGRALILEEGSFRSFDVDDPSKLLPRVPADFLYLFGETQDLRVIENSDMETVQQELEHDSDSALALELALVALDSELPDDIRQEAIVGLKELLTTDRVAQCLENVLYTRPLPEDADLTTALELANDPNLSPVLELLRRLEARQPFITEISYAWELIPTKIFGDYDRQAIFLRAAVREGLFRNLVLTRETQDTTSSFLLNAGLNNSVKQLRNYRQVLQHWTTSFRQCTEVASETEIEEEVVVEASPRRRHGRRIGIDRPGIFKEVNKKKAIITRAMERRNFRLVGDLVDELVKYQLENGETEHAAKSLCDLAVKAKILAMYPLQLELTQRSIYIAPGDGWSWAQYGDALSNMQQFDAAKEAYRQADSFGAHLFAEMGNAEILRTLGNFDEALEIFNHCIAEYPDEPAIQNSRADVLKDKGWFDESLAAYDKIISENPENSVAKRGRADLLKTKGDLTGALAAYDQILEQDPNDLIARNGRAKVLHERGNLELALSTYEEIFKASGSMFSRIGRAEVLKAMGRLNESLSVYDDILSEQPTRQILRSARSSVLAALGHYNEALEFVPTNNPITAEDWVAQHIRGMILIRIGSATEAIEILSQGVQKCPWRYQQAYFRTALAVAWLRAKDFDKASDVLDEVESAVLQPAANVLRIHSFGALGKLERAARAYENLRTAPHFLSNELTQELRREYLLGEKPRYDEDWIVDREIRLILLAA